MNLDECIKYISDWFLSDTVELLDLVLDDDIEDPKYSAITTLNRFWVYLQYKNKVDQGFKCYNVSSLLKKMGYSSEDIALFKKKAQDERKIYTADILDADFFQT
ncbi:MAG: hypothetical protein ACI4II_01075 [Acutalibacteraceae bacterium]